MQGTGQKILVLSCHVLRLSNDMIQQQDGSDATCSQKAFVKHLPSDSDFELSQQSETFSIQQLESN